MVKGSELNFGLKADRETIYEGKANPRFLQTGFSPSVFRAGFNGVELLTSPALRWLSLRKGFGFSLKLVVLVLQSLGPAGENQESMMSLLLPLNSFFLFLVTQLFHHHVGSSVQADSI